MCRAAMAGELLVSVAIDPALDFCTELRVPCGTSVYDLAGLLADQDPTGQTAAADVAFRLREPGSPHLSGDTRLDERYTSLELCCPEPPEPAPGSSAAALAPDAPPAPEPEAAPSPGATASLVAPEPEAAPSSNVTASPVAPEPAPTQDQEEPQVRRGALYAISDTHCEAKPNMSWLEELPGSPEDTIILAGDIGVEISNLETALRLFVTKYKHVFYCFGNHECWISKHKFNDSFEKIAAIRSVCDSLGVRTKPALLEGTWIVPIIGWYHTSWDAEPPLQVPDGSKLKREPRAPDKMSNDYLYCRWGDYENGSDELARHMDSLNEAWGAWPLPEELLAEARRVPGERAHPIVTFSHFLPRNELFLEKRMSMEPNLSKLIGGNWIRDRVDQLRPDIHVFGHTHMCWDMHLDGVRYMSWPLGMPEERYWRAMAYPRSDCAVPLKILDSCYRQAPREDVCFGSRVYELLDRDPHSCVMAHRVANKFCPEAPILFDDVAMPGRRTSWQPVKDAKERERFAEAARKLKELRRRDPPIYPLWRVVGGEDRGGILVREGAKLDSAKCAERLSTGALVEEVSIVGDRLMYRLLAGTGPDTGWVAIELPDKELLVPEPMPPKPGSLKLERVLQLQEALIDNLSKRKVQDEMRALLQKYKGKERTLRPFADARRAILQPQFDHVLMSFGFPKGNMMELDPVILEFYNFLTGDQRVKRNKCRIEELMFLHPSSSGTDIVMGA